MKKVCFPFCVSECFKIKINTNKIKEEGAEEQGGFTGKKVLVTCAYIYIYIYIWSPGPSSLHESAWFWKWLNPKIFGYEGMKNDNASRSS